MNSGSASTHVRLRLWVKRPLWALNGICWSKSVRGAHSLKSPSSSDEGTAIFWKVSFLIVVQSVIIHNSIAISLKKKPHSTHSIVSGVSWCSALTKHDTWDMIKNFLDCLQDDTIMLVQCVYNTGVERNVKSFTYYFCFNRITRILRNNEYTFKQLIFGTDRTVLQDLSHINCRTTFLHTILQHTWADVLHLENVISPSWQYSHLLCSISAQIFGQKAGVCCNEFCFQNQILYLGKSIWWYYCDARKSASYSCTVQNW